MGSLILYAGKYLAKRAILSVVKGSGESDMEDDSPELTAPDDQLDETNPVTEEIFSSWALFILLFLLGSALYTSYFLQQRRIKAVHETVLSIFYGMVVGLIIRVSPGHYIQDTVKFNSSYFFNILLPPIILNSGYELHQANFFRNIGTILTFAIPGTLVSALVVGIILYLWTALGLDGVKLEFVDAIAVGATLSATDPVTILSIFNAYKVDPKLYTIIFGESLLNDAISIVMFETSQKFHGHPVHFLSLFEGLGLFLMTFTISTIIGLMIGILVALVLKHSHLRRYPQIETCLVLLFAYESYFFSNGAHMSGIVSLLFCGITLKHYAYYNMLRRTQIATKYIFQLLAQLSENFIFIYLGLSLFTEVELVFKPLLIIVTFISICVARWSAVFPLSRLLNFLYRAKFKEYTNRSSFHSGGISYQAVPDEISHSYQVMIFWAGLRGAVGVALAMGLQAEAKWTLLANVLVVVVLTVILFGGTTASMLEILGIKTGCVDERAESDDEFEIETLTQRLSLSGQDAFNIGQSHTHQLGNMMSNRPFKKSNGAQNASNVSLGSHLLRSSLQHYFDDDVHNGSANNKSVDNLVDDDDDELVAQHEVDDLISGPTSPSTNLVQLDSGNGLLGSFLNGEEHAKWFTRFDEEVLKPVLLDTLPLALRGNGSSGQQSS